MGERSCGKLIKVRHWLYCHVLGWLLMGFWIGYWPLTHDSELQAVTTSLLISIIHKSPQHLLSLFQPSVSSPAIPWQQLLTVELPVLKSSLHRLPNRTFSSVPFLHSLPYRTDLVASIVFLITPLHWVENTISNSTYIVAFLSIATGMCLLSHCLEMAPVYLLI
jgi:hypothetical protein